MKIPLNFQPRFKIFKSIWFHADTLRVLSQLAKTSCSFVNSIFTNVNVIFLIQTF